VHALKIVIDAKDASTVNKYLHDSFPLPTLPHLKRLRKVAPSDESTIKTTVEVIVDLAPEDLEIEDTLAGFPVPYEAAERISVPRSGPKSKDQFAAYNRIWPVVFHQSMDKKLAEAAHREAETAIADVWKRFIDSDEECWVITFNGNKITTSTTNPSHPLKHSTIVAIDLVARLKADAKLPASQYLSQGYYYLLRREPCFMCAMAMVHSRVKAVIFLEYNTARGALASKTDCTWLAATNHKYSVYRLLPDAAGE
jgi:tRNA(Arg) A34 adenosine deaminase TadA